MSFAEYRKIERMNASTLVHGLHSMRRLKRYIDKQADDEPTVCKELGTATHVLLQEPEEFEANYAVLPDFHLDPNNLRKAKNKSETEEDRRTDSKATDYYKKRVAEFAELNKGKQLIDRASYDKCLYAIECIRSHHSAADLLVDVEFEKTLFGEISGIPFKVRVDMLGVNHRRVTDLKTSYDASPHRFGRTAANMHYDFKLAIYREIARQNYHGVPCVNILVQEIGGDFDTCVVNVPDIVLDNAATEVQQVIDRYKIALSTGKWYGVDQGMRQVELVVPNWKMQDDLDSSFDEEVLETEEVGF